MRAASLEMCCSCVCVPGRAGWPPSARPSWCASAQGKSSGLECKLRVHSLCWPGVRLGSAPVVSGGWASSWGCVCPDCQPPGCPAEPGLLFGGGTPHGPLACRAGAPKMPALCRETPAGAAWEQLCPDQTSPRKVSAGLELLTDLSPHLQPEERGLGRSSGGGRRRGRREEGSGGRGRGGGQVATRRGLRRPLPAGTQFRPTDPFQPPRSGRSSRSHASPSSELVDASLERGGTHAVSGPGVSGQGGWARTPWPPHPGVVWAPSPRLPSAVLCLPERVTSLH